MSNIDNSYFDTYTQILLNELKPAMGCTEPASIALAAAKARAVLGCIPEHILVELSGNVLKNAKSAFVPNTCGLRGVRAAAAAGVIAGDADLLLDVLENITPEQSHKINEYISQINIEVRCPEDFSLFDIRVTVYSVKDNASVRITENHTNFTEIKHGDTMILKSQTKTSEKSENDKRSLLSVEKIVYFAQETALDEIKPALERQIQYNMGIAQEGITHSYGACIGSTILSEHKHDIEYRMCAMAAAACDARMNGCEMPVIINSGSGNQGITCSVPVIVYAKEKGLSHDLLLRALCISNLITIRLKYEIGTLSAYCGAVCAGCGAAAGINYLQGGGYTEIAHTIVNTLAVTSGMICDGAKASCAAKVASSIQAGLLGLSMYRHGRQFLDGDGIVRKGVENTIANMGKLAREGMSETDRKILQIMTEC